MIIEWDEAKNRINQKNHGLDFGLAQQVFDDPLHISRQDRHIDGEERWQTLGSIGGLNILLVAHTINDDEGSEVIRIISARKATTHEKNHYEQAN